MSTPGEALERSIVVGTAGHIDHGKTMLVRALTGVDTDRLPEEKRRGITVDLGFATFELAGTSGEHLRLDLIDVPGHKQFVRNMLAGAGGIDFVMLVIAANEGVMPQTEEHLAICELLGVRCGLTVLTKSDLVSEEELSAVCESVRSALAGSFLADAAIVPVSAQSGFGMPAVRDELAKLAEQVPLRSTLGLPRLPLDRSFVVKGFGTVVTGTLQSGRLAVGQTLMLEPGGTPVRVRGLQRQGRAQTEAFAGSRVALNLSGVEVAQVRRGATLVLSKTLQAVETIDAEVSLLASAPALVHGARVRLHSFTSEAVARISIYGYGVVAPGASQIVRLKLANPVLLVPGDRFVLRRLSPAQTIGGGRVLDAHLAPRTPRKQALLWLEKMRDASPAQQLRLRVERCGRTGISLPQLAQEMGWTADAARTAAEAELASGTMRLLAERILVSKSGIEEAQSAVLGLLGGASGSVKPATGGVKKSELRNQAHLGPEVFEVSIEMLTQQQRLVLRGDSGHEMVYPAGAKPDGGNPPQVAAVAEIYRRAALNPPIFAEMLREVRLNEREGRACLTLLLRDKTLVKIAAADVYMHSTSVDALEATIRGLKGQTLDVARLKQITGLSRKYAIPLLEYLDRQRITRRQGDTRIVL